jgi:hypothetical protein
LARQLSGVHRSDMTLTPEQKPLLMGGSEGPGYTQPIRQPPERVDFLLMSSRSILLFEHDLFGKPAPTFPDHAAGIRPVKTSPCGKSRIRIC